MSNKITKFTQKTTLAKVLELKNSEKVLSKHKVPCLTCPMAKFEMENLTIGQVCQMYKIDAKKIIDDLSKLCPEKKH